MAKPKVSLNMIVKNEEKYLPRCLKSVEGLFNEIIIVDTGSNDRTVEVAKTFGATVIPFKWIDDFSAARNCAIDHSTGDWIFWLDGDDFFIEEEKKKLEELLSQLDLSNKAYRFMTRRVNDPENHVGGNTFIRLYRNNGIHRYRGFVHETLIDSFEESEVEEIPVDIRIERSRDYKDENTQQKERFYIKLLEREIKEGKIKPGTYFDKARSHHILEEFNEAIENWKNYFEITDPLSPMYQHAIYYYCKDLVLSGKIYEAISHLEKARSLFPSNGLLLYLEANIRQGMGLHSYAEALFEELYELAEETNSKELKIEQPVAKALALHRVAEMQFNKHDYKAAENLWKQALKHNPKYKPAIEGLKQINEQR